MQAQLRTWGPMQEERLLAAPAETFFVAIGITIGDNCTCGNEWGH